MSRKQQKAMFAKMGDGGRTSSGTSSNRDKLLKKMKDEDSKKVKTKKQRMGLVSKARLQFGIGELSKDLRQAQNRKAFAETRLSESETRLRNAKRTDNKEHISDAKDRIKFEKDIINSTTKSIKKIKNEFNKGAK